MEGKACAGSRPWPCREPLKWDISPILSTHLPPLFQGISKHVTEMALRSLKQDLICLSAGVIIVSRGWGTKPPLLPRPRTMKLSKDVWRAGLWAFHLASLPQQLLLTADRLTPFRKEKLSPSKEPNSNHAAHGGRSESATFSAQPHTT